MKRRAVLARGLLAAGCTCAAAGWAQDTVAPSASPAARQAGQLQILVQERSEILARLSGEEAAPSASGDARAERLARLRADLRAIDAELARVSRQAPAALRNAGAPAARPQPGGLQANPAHQARQAAAPAAAIPGSSRAPWDVFRNFGPQGDPQ